MSGTYIPSEADETSFSIVSNRSVRLVEFVSVLPVLILCGVVGVLFVHGGVEAIEREFFLMVIFGWAAIGSITAVFISGTSVIRYIYDDVSVERIIPGFLLLYLAGFLVLFVAVAGQLEGTLLLFVSSIYGVSDVISVASQYSIWLPSGFTRSPPRKKSRSCSITSST